MFKAEHNLGAAVRVDEQLDGCVAAVRFYAADPEYLVAWFCNGESKSDWFAAWRVTRIDG